MKIVSPNVFLLEPINSKEILKKIELAGRTCYKSEGKITENSCYDFAKKIIHLGHESVLEHHSISVRVKTNRAITHEIVRHRIGSYSQESTRYINYDKRGEVEFILPEGITPLIKEVFEDYFRVAEKMYKEIVSVTKKTDIARDCLPMAVASEIVITYNIRSWRHFFKLRLSKKAHPQIRNIAKMILCLFCDNGLSVLFEDLHG